MKFTVGFVALALISMLVSGVYLINVLDNYFMDSLRGKLLVEAKLVREMVIYEYDTQKPSTTMDELAGKTWEGNEHQNNSY